MPDELDRDLVARLVDAALEEDAARRDVTTQALIAPEQRGAGTIVAKATGVVCGRPVAEAAFASIDPKVHFEACVPEGANVSPGGTLARVEGPLASILNAERVALNFLQRLSGIATATRQLVDTVAGTNARILDTRKTTPGLRSLERYAVRVGGGENHRYDLSDAVLIKDNHLAVCRRAGMSIADVVRRARGEAPAGMQIEIEVTAIDEAREVLGAGADIVLLDNMPVEEMRRVAELARGRAQLEASGGITIENVRAVAEAGVDRISVGAITHSAPALDISLELDA